VVIALVVFTFGLGQWTRPGQSTSINDSPAFRQIDHPPLWLESIKAPVELLAIGNQPWTNMYAGCRTAS